MASDETDIDEIFDRVISEGRDFHCMIVIPGKSVAELMGAASILIGKNAKKIDAGNLNIEINGGQSALGSDGFLRITVWPDTMRTTDVITTNAGRTAQMQRKLGVI